MAIHQDESFLCPYCGRGNTFRVDFSAGHRQEFVTDCETCCAPIVVEFTCEGTSVIDLIVKKENE